MECPRVTAQASLGVRTEALRPRGQRSGDMIMRRLALDLPAGYYLERDPDVLVLRRVDGSVAGAFSARGAAPEAVRQLIEETEGQGFPAYLPHPPTREEPSLRVFFF